VTTGGRRVDLRRGRVRRGFAAGREPTGTVRFFLKRRQSPSRLAFTVLDALVIDPRKELTRPDGRPVPILIMANGKRNCSVRRAHGVVGFSLIRSQDRWVLTRVKHPRQNREEGRRV